MNSTVEYMDEPCLVKAMQGFSVTYKNRLLYSKYAPEKNILHVIKNSVILSETLILCVSPALGLGLDALSAKLPENTVMLGIEADNSLFEFSKRYCTQLECCKKGNFIFLEPNDLQNFPVLINSRSSKWRGVFKRVVRIDFSAGSSFYADFYDRFYEAMQHSIAQFWKNRITLVKFGRRYARNFFQNLHSYSNSGSVEELFECIEKPILVLGAGEGLENAISLPKERLSQFFLIAVDAALPTLKSLGIPVDAVVCEESQSVISECFAGLQKSADFAICSLSSCPRAAMNTGNKCLFYTTLFDDLAFIEKARKARIIPPIIPPLGSVGVTAVFLALKFRHSEDIPVTTFGLDFSFSLGKTHARGTVQHIKRICSQSKIRPLENYGANFCEGAFFTADKNNRTITTTVALNGYAHIFRNYFYNAKNLFDGANSGLNLGLPIKTLISKTDGSQHSLQNKIYKTNGTDDIEKKQKIIEYLETEKNALQDLKSILTGEKKVSELERNEKIRALLFERDYLFFHFPDGLRVRFEQDFLNRIRAELDGFLKILK